MFFIEREGLQNLEKIIENFSKVKVLVVGDVMLDQYLWGSVSRISPEAPVPIVNVDKTSLNLGGAANVAANIAGLGACPALVGITGKDKEAETLAQVLKKTDICSENLVSLEKRQTTIKTRIVAHSQHVVRFDQETVNQIDEDEANVIFLKLEKLLDDVRLVIISDYAKGFLTGNFTKRLITTAVRQNKIILVDPKGKDFSKYKGATVLTPNRKEAIEACHINDRADAAEIAGKKLLDNLGLKAILVTQGEKGMTLFKENNEIYHLEALARKVYDVTGAGDTVIASFAVALGAGADYLDAAKIANFSAGLVVEQIGTTAITAEMLKEAVKIQGL
ncbi:MAG: PfkB domain protein [Acidobacteria bacterium]|nr:PfkB domain protein [Acidobacteriota bacterium]